ncbi:MAG: prolipoprotein diacylglyceryl transferase family protein [bacterium]
MWLFMILYGILRSIVEMFRGDIDRGFVMNNYLSYSQAISIPVVLFAFYMLIFYKKEKFILPYNRG